MTIIRILIIFTTILTILPTVAIDARAELKDDIGYTALAAAVGHALPTGKGFGFTHVEAAVDGKWMPDQTNPQLMGKKLVARTRKPDLISSHATGVARLLYGKHAILCPDAGPIDVYEADDWIGSGFLCTGVSRNNGDALVQPNYDHETVPWTLAAPFHVACHSWIGTVDTSDALRRMDFVVETDEYLQVAGISNNSRAATLWNSAFNIIAVGRTDGGYPQYTVFLDPVYHAGRVRPHIVAPGNATSSAAPLVAGACGLLIQAAGDPSLSTDPAHRYTADRNVMVIYNAERSEVIKAALMAGADRITHNTSTEDLFFYRGPGHRSDNGLDTRYGAGQLNIYNSYFIVKGGEQNSREDLPAEAGAIGRYGFDYDPSFGGLNSSNATGTYSFTTGRKHNRLYAALVWHIDIAGGDWNDFDPTATLYNMDLSLFDVTDPETPMCVAASRSAAENAENIWAALLPEHVYEIRVTAVRPVFEWDYALAWRIVSPPDNDGDGMDDDWETQYGLQLDDPDDARLDMDGDAIPNAAEYTAGTRPDMPDTDRDGAPDGAEINSGGNPVRPTDGPAMTPRSTPYYIGALVALLLIIAGAIGMRKKP